MATNVTPDDEGWQIPRDDFRRMVDSALRQALADDPADLEQRQRMSLMFLEIAERSWSSHEGAGSKRGVWHWIGRIAAATTAVASAGSGTALAANATGPLASVLGVAAVVIGLVGAVATGLRPDDEYLRNREKSRRYEQVWRRARIYALVTLPSLHKAVVARAVKTELDALNDEIMQIGLKDDSSSASR